MEIGTVVSEIQKAEFGNFTVPVNNTLVCLASSFVFLAADTLLCVLICNLNICSTNLQYKYIKMVVFQLKQ